MNIIERLNTFSTDYKNGKYCKLVFKLRAYTAAMIICLIISFMSIYDYRHRVFINYSIEEKLALGVFNISVIFITCIILLIAISKLSQVIEYKQNMINKYKVLLYNIGYDLCTLIRDAAEYYSIENEIDDREVFLKWLLVAYERDITKLIDSKIKYVLVGENAAFTYDFKKYLYNEIIVYIRYLIKNYIIMEDTVNE